MKYYFAAVGFFLIFVSPAQAVTRLLCTSGTTPPRMESGHPGHSPGHSEKPGQEAKADFLIRLLFTSGRGRPPATIEELHRAGGVYPPRIREYQVLSDLSTGEWPAGTYLAMSTVGDKAVLTLWKSGAEPAHPPGHQPAPSPSPHPGHPPGHNPTLEAQFRGTYAYMIEDFTGILPVQCRFGE